MKGRVLLMEDLLKSVRRIHFIGIGGSGMFPIVQILKEKGYVISGSDNNESDIVRMARENGIDVMMEQKKENIGGQDLIIYTSAILEDNEELVAAKNSGIKTIERNEFLGYFTKKYDSCICVCGTHGKTTTTSMLTQIFVENEKSPTAIIGGKLDLINGYSCLGKSSILICEACEYKDHFLKLWPDTVVVLNIDNDHLEYFKNMDNLKKSFRRFCEKSNSLVVYNGDDENTKTALKGLEKRNISFGYSDENDYFASGISVVKGICTRFSVYKDKELVLKDVEINIPGKHNVLNALASIVVSLENGISKDGMLASLKRFKGAKRRFELIGVVGGVTVLDDYAHHPSEIDATLRALKGCGFRKIWVVHQPFTFSRTIMLKEQFKDALNLADRVIITEILGSREKNVYGVSGQDLADSLNCGIYIKEQKDAKEYILKNAKEGDVVITMGCGDIYKCAKMIVYGKY